MDATTTPRHRNYKTQLCRHFLRGFCQRGSECDFAHGSHELRILNMPPQFSCITVKGNEPYASSPPELNSDLRQKLEILTEEYVIIQHSDIPCSC